VRQLSEERGRALTGLGRRLAHASRAKQPDRWVGIARIG
jgi:hypothetical protein